MEEKHSDASEEIIDILNAYRARQKAQSDAPTAEADPIPEAEPTPSPEEPLSDGEITKKPRKKRNFAFWKKRKKTDGPEPVMGSVPEEPSPVPDAVTTEIPPVTDGAPTESEATVTEAPHFDPNASDPSEQDGENPTHFTDPKGAKKKKKKKKRVFIDPDHPYAHLPLSQRIVRYIFRFFANATFLLKAAVYIVVVLIISAYLSYYAVTIANDVFAFTGGETEITLTLSDEPTADEVAELLYRNGLIRYKWVFNLFMKYYGDGEDFVFIPGEHTLNTGMNYSQLLYHLTTEYRVREIVTITFPEGFTVDQIIDLFLSNGIGTREGFVEAINNYPYKHEFVRLLDEKGYPEDRVYRLEGYLYPDTYDFYTDTAEYLAINKLLNNFNDKIWVDWKRTYAEVVEGQGLSLDDIVTLSSLIEAEGKTAEDFEFISYVFRNRLNNSTDFPRLESDATIQYAYALAGIDREQNTSLIDVNFASPYNTYRSEGLPPGAICNAGMDAILAAIYPAPPRDEDGADIDAFYFVSNNAGRTYYAATEAGHEKNKERVKKENEAMAHGTDDPDDTDTSEPIS